MKNFFIKTLFVAGVFCVSSNGFAATIECDTILSPSKGNVYISNLVNESQEISYATIEDAEITSSTIQTATISDVNIKCNLILKAPQYSSSTIKKSCTGYPTLEIWRSYDARGGVFEMAFDSTGGKRDFLLEHQTGEGDHGPISFRASQYTFNFHNIMGTGVMTVNGKIVCKEELKVAEVNTEQINAKEINVALNQAADYVFDEQYSLQPLNEVEAYVKENKHLPGVPSAEEFSSKGMNVSQMSNLLLEKVEELTLHLIQMQKEMEILKAKNEELERKCNMK